MCCKKTEDLAVVYFLLWLELRIYISNITNPDLWESYIILNFLSPIFISSYCETRSFIAPSYFTVEISVYSPSYFHHCVTVGKGNSHNPNVKVFVTVRSKLHFSQTFPKDCECSIMQAETKQSWRGKNAIIKFSDMFIKYNNNGSRIARYVHFVKKCEWNDNKAM